MLSRTRQRVSTIGLFFVITILSLNSVAEQYTKEVLKAADFNVGRTGFLQRCSACHTLNEGGLDILGPNMWKMFDRVVGSKDGYIFSDAMKEADFKWTADILAEWLTNPDSMLKGSKMILPEPVPKDIVADILSFMFVETGAADWPRPRIVFSEKERDKSLPPAERFPSFWNHMMTNTTRYRLVTSDNEEYIFKAYFNENGSITTDQRGMRGFWYLNEKDFFCYALYGMKAEPKYMVECFPVAAMAIPRFREELWESRPQKNWTLYGGILPGRPE